MNAISLFSGIGGFDLGLQKAGINITHQSEKDPACVKILKRHWPKVEQLGDIDNATIPNSDVFVGGFPCQDLSVAGHRKGLAGNRSGLWFSFLRGIQRNHPRYVVIENVPGLLSSQGGRDFGTILNGLAQCGYHVAWRVLDAAGFGVPQQRRRLFIVGSLRDGSAAKVLFEPESTGGDRKEIYGGNPRSSQEINAVHCIGVSFRGILRQHNHSTTITTRSTTNCKQCVVDSTGRMRRLMPVECERLQGFPDGWTSGQRDRTRYRQLGNAVCVPVAQWIGNRIVEFGQ